MDREVPLLRTHQAVVIFLALRSEGKCHAGRATCYHLRIHCALYMIIRPSFLTKVKNEDLTLPVPRYNNVPHQNFNQLKLFDY